MSDFQSFRTAVIKGRDLQEQIIRVIDTAIVDGLYVEEGIVSLAMSLGYTFTLREMSEYVHSVSLEGAS
jgi:hypothetical protein